jgi:amino acid adenylation domain-containing protein
VTALTTGEVGGAHWRGLPELFAEQVERSPEAIAIRFEGESLTYTQLAEQSHRLTRALIGRGAGHDSIVPILMDRSPQTIVAILGVLAAGGCCLPVDPEAPVSRTRVMVDDSGASLILTVAAHAETAALLGPADVMCIDDPHTREEIASHRPDRIDDWNRIRGLGPRDPAFVIFTSGTTGTPKGSVNTHAGMVNCLQWLRDGMGLNADDRVLHQTTLIFDMSIAEIFLPLITGAVLVIARPGEQTDPASIARLIQAESVTAAFFVPTLLHYFLDDDAAPGCETLRLIYSLGETLTGRLQAFCHARLPAVTLWNSYGPSEAAIAVTLWECRRQDGDMNPPIGHPSPQTDLLILDEDLKPIAPGAAGELFIAGTPLSRGYLRRPEVTAEKFLRCPFGPPGALMYRTGDIVVLREDGALEYRGRRDNQVKINGVRVEPGEIEVAITAVPGIGRAAVVPQVLDGKKRLVAYLVAEPGAVPPDPGEVRAALAERLPPPMVPSHFMVLDEFPRTPSGKLAVRQLPDPPIGNPEPTGVASRFVEARTDAEQALAEIWRDVLGLDDVGVRDSFFGLGGDSILAIRIANRAQRAGLALSVPDLFAADTIQAQALVAGGYAAPEPGESIGVGPVQAPRLQVEHAPSSRRRRASARPSPRTASLQPAGLPLTPIGTLDERGIASLRAAHPDIEDAFPLTPVQQGMLFHTLLAPGSGDYVEQTISVVEHADTALIEQVWVTTLMRHEALRTSVSLRAGQPAAVVHTAVTPWVRHLDWTDLDRDGRRRELDVLLEQDRVQDYDPMNPPLWRLYIVREPGERVRCVWSHHHLILDGWSLMRLLNDVSSALAAAIGGCEPATTPARPFREYAAWWAGQDHQGALDFWASELSGIHEGTGLGLPPPAAGADRRGRGRSTLRLERAAIDRFCRAERVTTATVLQGAVAMLLSRYRSNDDVVFGIASSGRAIDLDGADTMVGNLLYLVPVRVGTGGNSPVGVWLRGLQERQAVTHGYGHVSLADFQREAAVADGHELIQVLVNFEDYHLGAGADALHDVEIVDAAHVPVVASFSGVGDALELRLVYDRSLFDDDAMNQVAGHLKTLVDELTDDPHRPLDAVELLSAEERRTVIDQFNPSAVPLAPTPVHELIGRGDDVALRSDGRSITYAELDAAANRLAHTLRDLGAGRDVPVALCIQRSPDLVTAMLAVLRAGSPYLPLDPGHPIDRLDFTVRDAGVRIVVTDTAGRATLAPIAAADAVEILDLAADAARIATAPSTAPAADVGLDDLAYILYTSGSTGEPKGVAQTHRAIVNMLHWMVGEYGLGPQDRWLFKTPTTFDVSVPDVFFPLAVGGVVVIAQPGAHADPAAIAGLIAAERVSVVQFVPSMLEVFLEEPSVAECGSLRYVLCAGEKLHRGLAQRCRSVLPHAALTNLYGPTETFYVTDYPCRTDELRDPPIGRPIANTRAYLLDSRRKPVPFGATGELWIAGAGVARGYLGGGLAEERFLVDPFVDAPGERMYRTGDLARWLPDGELDYVGRVDGQVKVNGQRVELGEIESVIRSLPGVDSAAVAVQQTPAGRQQLVGYVIGPNCDGPNRSLDMERIAAALRQRLPRAYVPTAWMTLDALPVTANGKLDRRALPRPRGLSGSPHPATEPSPLERQLCTLWAEVLGESALNSHDDVFAAGADSISCVRMLSRAKSHGLELDVKTIVANPTPAGQTRVLEGGIPGVGTRAPRPIMYVFPGLPGTVAHVGLIRLCAACSDIVDMRIVEYPGWTTICRRSMTFDDIVSELSRTISDRPPGEEILLSGYSLGGAVAYAVALRMAGLGRRIAFVGILDSEPPTLTAQWTPRGEPVQSTRSRIGRIVTKVIRSPITWASELSAEKFAYEMSQLPTPLLRIAPAIARVLRPLSGERFAEQMRRTLMAPITLRWLRRPDRMSEHLDVPLVLFRTARAEETQEWAQRTTRLETVIVGGDHASMLSEPHFADFVAAFRSKVKAQLH